MFQAFNNVFQRSISTAPEDEEMHERVRNLIDTVTFNTFQYTSRALFEKDKLTFTVQVSFTSRPLPEASFNEILQKVSCHSSDTN